MDFLKPVMPYGIGIALVLIALWCLKQFLGESFKEFGKRFALWLVGGNRTLGRRRQKRYRKNLLQNASKHPLGFLRDQTVEIDRIYVPLQVAYGGQRRDVYREIQGRSRVVILGSAGAGKSMLLKSSAYRWAKSRPEGSRLPVIVELHRYNEDGASLTGLAEEALARNGIRAAGAMLEKAMVAGKVSLLLDGLDEVSTSRRARAMQEIRAIAETYPSCQFIITCRDATYDGGLAPTFENPVTIAAFDDAAMRRFLFLWFTDQEKTDSNIRKLVDRMMADLRSNPSVLRLARSPLLLTMMASLHTMDPGLGPSFMQSRAEFYREAIEHLLRRDFDLGRHESVASYRAGHKLLLLRRIALHVQGADDPHSDGRTISEPGALKLAKALLAELNMEAPHARPMFDEIVERSELLIPVDGARLQYEFPHLTLQEYLAAVELGDDPERLLTLYQANPTRWRETVKLWCAGVNRDCTRVITQVFGSNSEGPLLALECLAEAKKVDDAVAVRIVDHFQRRLGTRDSDSALIVAALGAVAGDSGPRGRAGFDFLRDTASSSMNEDRRTAAMQALAASRQSAAVKILATLAVRYPAAHNALRSMGEQAVPELVALAAAGSLTALDDIAAIGTPSAALGLCELIWTDSDVARRAAWRLGELIGSTDVNEEIRLAALDFPRNSPRLDWVWEPFDQGNVRAVMGRVAYLILDSSLNDAPAGVPSLDPRLALPLASAATADEFRPDYLPFADPNIHARIKVLAEVAAKHRRRVRPSTTFERVSSEVGGPLGFRSSLLDFNPNEALPICLDFLTKAGATARTIKLWLSLPARAAVVLAAGAFLEGKPTRRMENEWRRINRKLVDDELLGTLGAALLLIALAVPAALGLSRSSMSLFGIWAWGPRYLHVLAIVPIILGALFLYVGGKGGKIGEAAARVDIPVVAIAAVVSIVATSVIGVSTVGGWIGLVTAVIAFFGSLVCGVSLVSVAIMLSGRLTHVFSEALRSARVQANAGASIIGKHRSAK
ncbi:NACHT domain-containing protein [Micromonospora aurantiaca (nom. illeg.)]|uniref:NACHT domain-containing protein n=1 Tax=Micromonospora aurantiaca (nom. illeg.) TaxID=47850 RepID=UPI0033D8BE15